MRDYISKWNKYKIGSVRWLNKNRTHYSRVKFIDYIADSDIRDILEIGGGELWEAQKLLEVSNDLNYTVGDISPTFLKFAEETEGVTACKADMINLPFEDKQFDIIYVNSVIEHSPDIVKTIKEFSRVSNRFYLTMFKWNNLTGGLESFYKEKKRFYSTVFNINELMDLINTHGEIESMFLCSKRGYISTFEEYRKKYPNEAAHRDVNYLSIVGKWND